MSVFIYNLVLNYSIYYKFDSLNLAIEFVLKSRADLVFNANIVLTKWKLETEDSEDSASSVSEYLVSDAESVSSDL